MQPPQRPLETAHPPRRLLVGKILGRYQQQELAARYTLLQLLPVLGLQHLVECLEIDELVQEGA